MMQVMRILAKDARRFWPEILISLATTAGFLWFYPNLWRPEAYYTRFGYDPFVRHRLLTIVAYTLTALLPITWWLLISRVIHAESLVGDRQYWLTRPYVWWKLLLAKLAFVMVFVMLPFAIAQCLLLKEAGLETFLDIRSLLFNLFLMFGALILPLTVLASVTRNFARNTLTLLGVLVCIAGLAALGGYFSNRFIGVNYPYGDRFSLPAIVIVAGSALVLQYARRKVWLARFLLVTVAPVVAIIAVWYPTPGMVEAVYRPQVSAVSGTAIPTTPAPAVIQFMSDPTHPITTRKGDRDDLTELGIPLQLSGLEHGRAVAIDDVRATIVDSNGRSREIPWQAGPLGSHLPGVEGFDLYLKMPRNLYQEVKGRRVKVHLEFALTEERALKPRVISLPESEFRVEGFGICPPGALWSNGYTSEGMECRTAFHGPPLTYITAEWSNEPCGKVPSGPDSGARGAAWVGSVNNDPADLGFTSVWTTKIYLTNSYAPITSEDSSAESRRRYLCAGTPVSFTEYEVVRRTRIGMQLPEIVVPEEKADQIILLDRPK